MRPSTTFESLRLTGMGLLPCLKLRSRWPPLSPPVRSQRWRRHVARGRWHGLVEIKFSDQAAEQNFVVALDAEARVRSRTVCALNGHAVPAHGLAGLDHAVPAIGSKFEQSQVMTFQIVIGDDLPPPLLHLRRQVIGWCR